MKCPQCLINQKFKDGMTCRGCGYRFALHPKEPPQITDAAFRSAVDRLSQFGRFYFTWDQLYAQIHRLIRQKKRIGLIPLIIGGGFFAVLGSGMIMGALGLGCWAAILWSGLLVAGIIRLRLRPVRISPEMPAELIRKYQALHPIEHLADGGRLGKTEPPPLKEELFAHAPEAILIVEQDDMAEMLILNRFHFENRILVVGSRGYPKSAFDACRRFLTEHPDIPVYLAHDCSHDGIQMQAKLLTDPKWRLEGKRIINLGLHPRDVERARNPIWIPEDFASGTAKKKPPGPGTPAEHIQNGYRVPLGAAPPGALTGALTLALASGLPLMSEDLLAQQRENAAGGSGGLSFGFG